MGHLGLYKGLLECYVVGPLSYISFNQSEQSFTKVEVNNGEYLPSWGKYPPLSPTLKSTVVLTFHSQYLICNSCYFMPQNSYDISLENLVLDQIIISWLIFILITSLLDIVLVLWGEILSWSHMGVRGFNCQFTVKWLEVSLLTCNWVSSRTGWGIICANQTKADQSGCMKGTPPVWYFLIALLILLTVSLTSPVVLTRRICLTIKSCLS